VHRLVQHKAVLREGQVRVRVGPERCPWAHLGQAQAAGEEVPALLVTVMAVQALPLGAEAHRR